MRFSGFVFVIISALSWTAWSGTPDQDPTVKILRQKFQDAKLPDVASLKYGVSRLCSVHRAYKNDFEQRTDSRIKFTEFDSLVKLEDLSISGEYLLGNLQNELSGSTPKGSVISVRVTDRNDIVIEVARASNSVDIAVPSIARAAFAAYTYGICPGNL